MSSVEKYITSIPDFPEPGIIFRDITSVLCSPEGLKLAIDEMTDLVQDLDFDMIAGLESRGFIFGMPMAYKLGKPFIPVRKKGKLPRETVEASYDLEYGSATIEIHKEDVPAGAKILLVDDLMATGGTLAAAAELFGKVGAEVVGAVCLLELAGLHGREKLKGFPVRTVVCYEGK